MLLAGEREASSIPASALVDDGGVPVVYVQLEGESFARQEVQVRSRQGDALLVDGLIARRASRHTRRRRDPPRRPASERRRPKATCTEMHDLLDASSASRSGTACSCSRRRGLLLVARRPAGSPRMPVDIFPDLTAPPSP